MLLRPPAPSSGLMSVRSGCRRGCRWTPCWPLETRLKWPNDVLLGERKLAGILCEGRWHGDTLHWLAVGWV